MHLLTNTYRNISYVTNCKSFCPIFMDLTVSIVQLGNKRSQNGSEEMSHNMQKSFSFSHLIPVYAKFFVAIRVWYSFYFLFYELLRFYLVKEGFIFCFWNTQDLTNFLTSSFNNFLKKIQQSSFRLAFVISWICPALFKFNAIGELKTNI